MFSRQILRFSAKRSLSTLTEAATQTNSGTAIVDRLAVEKIVSSVASRHGFDGNLSATYPSLSTKFRVVTEAITECNAKLIGNRELTQIKTLDDLVCVLSSTGFAAPKSLLEQSYDVFNTEDTVEKLFSQLDAEGTRPINLYFSKS